MKFRWGMISLPISTALAACGPTTSLRNDTEASVWVDFIKVEAPRLPHPQEVVAGSLLTAPWPPNEASTLYVGNDPSNLRKFDVVTLCDLTKKHCDVRVSQLPVTSSNGS
ncbi:MAG: hypothetical protein ACOYLS_01030 [Polymorphobacter sp.]